MHARSPESQFAMTYVAHAEPRRNNSETHADHHDNRKLSDLTSGGRLIWFRTRRPVSTCNLLATIAGIGDREVE